MAGFTKVGCANYMVRNNTYTEKLRFWSLSVFKSILFSTNEYRTGAYLQDLMGSDEAYHFLTLGVRLSTVRIFFSYLCKGGVHICRDAYGVLTWEN